MKRSDTEFQNIENVACKNFSKKNVAKTLVNCPNVVKF